jgi:hypothetical protein
MFSNMPTHFLDDVVVADNIFNRMMPLIIQWVNLWRMFMRPVLKLLSDICWACTRNLTLIHHKNAIVGDVPLDAILAVQHDVDFSKKPQSSYTQV